MNNLTPTVATGSPSSPVAASQGMASAHTGGSPAVTPGPPICEPTGVPVVRQSSIPAPEPVEAIKAHGAGQGFRRYVPIARLGSSRHMPRTSARGVAGTSTGSAPVVRDRTPRPSVIRTQLAGAGLEVTKAVAGGLVFAVVVYLAMWWAIPADAFWR